jgi:hypothetical protein
MDHFRFTLFNAITLLILALTAAMAVHLIRARNAGQWPLAYYPVTAGFALGFPYSLNLLWVGAGLVLGVTLRAGWLPWKLRWLELPVLAYFAWRCVALLMMW